MDLESKEANVYDILRASQKDQRIPGHFHLSRPLIIIKEFKYVKQNKARKSET
jgi:hypothetical protein